MIGSNVEQFVIKGVYQDGIKTGVEKTTRSVKKLSNGMQEVTVRTRGANGKIKSFTKTIEKQREEFQMWALSFVFAGMQIKAVSEQITRASVGTFLKISEGNTEAGRSIIGLAAHFKFLQFEIGNAIGMALKPLMPILTTLIRGVAQFVQQHPELTFAAIASAFVLGTGMFLGGQMVLFANAAVTLVNQLGGLQGVQASLAGMKSSVSKLAGYAAGGILITLGIQDITEGVSEGDFNQLITGGLETLSGGLFLAGKTKAGVAALIGTIAFKIVTDSTFRESAANFLSQISRLVYAVGAGLVSWVKSVVMKPFTLLLEGIDMIKKGDYLGAATKFTGASMSLIAPQGESGAFGKGFSSAFNSFDLQSSSQDILGALSIPSNLLSTGNVYGERDRSGTTINANVVQIVSGSGSSGTPTLNEIGRMT